MTLRNINCFEFYVAFICIIRQYRCVGRFHIGRIVGNLRATVSYGKYGQRNACMCSCASVDQCGIELYRFFIVIIATLCVFDAILINFMALMTAYLCIFQLKWIILQIYVITIVQIESIKCTIECVLFFSRDVGIFSCLITWFVVYEDLTI